MPVDETLSKPYRNVSIRSILNERPNMPVAATSKSISYNEESQPSTQPKDSEVEPSRNPEPKMIPSMSQHYDNVSNIHEQSSTQGGAPKLGEEISTMKNTPLTNLGNITQVSPSVLVEPKMQSNIPFTGKLMKPQINNNQQVPHPQTSVTSTQHPIPQPPAGYYQMPYSHPGAPYYSVQPGQQDFMDVRHGRRFRRRYNQIVRKYRCSHPGCVKSYGSLNHLNTHIVSKKHGQRKSKADFQSNEEPNQPTQEAMWYGYPGRTHNPQYMGQVQYESGPSPTQYYVQRPPTVGWMVEPPILYHHQPMHRQLLQPNLTQLPPPNVTLPPQSAPSQLGMPSLPLFSSPNHQQPPMPTSIPTTIQHPIQPSMPHPPPPPPPPPPPSNSILQPPNSQPNASMLINASIEKNKSP